MRVWNARRDWAGVAVVVAGIGALLAYRAWYVEPRAWGAVCAAASAPVACAPRAALLWLQHWNLWGWGGLALGIWAFAGAGLSVAVGAVLLGAAGVVNYNATFGMLGAALGGWAWLTARPRRDAGQRSATI